MQTGVVEDIIIVPVAIAYDKLLERRFVRHELMVGVVLLSPPPSLSLSLSPSLSPPPPLSLSFSFSLSLSLSLSLTYTHTPSHVQGGSKRPETVMQVIRGAWAMLTKNTGSVRVDFAQPFSLQVRTCMCII